MFPALNKMRIDRVMKMFVVYFSQLDDLNNSTVVTNGEILCNTKYMAYVIQENTNANIFRVLV